MAEIPATFSRRWRLPPAAAAALAIVALTVSPGGAETPGVTIAGLAYSPASVPVQLIVGEPGFPEPHAHVSWTMADPGTEHTVTFDDARLVSSGRLAPGQRHEVVFPAAGTYAYRCTVHPAMTGSVVVSPAAASPPTSGPPPPVAPEAGLTATSEESSAIGGAAAVVLGLAVIAAVAALAWFLLRRRTPRAP